MTEENLDNIYSFVTNRIEDYMEMYPEVSKEEAFIEASEPRENW